MLNDNSTSNLNLNKSAVKCRTRTRTYKNYLITRKRKCGLKTRAYFITDYLVQILNLPSVLLFIIQAKLNFILSMVNGYIRHNRLISDDLSGSNLCGLFC